MLNLEKKFLLCLVPAALWVADVFAENTSPVPEPVRSSVTQAMADYDVPGLAIGRVVAGEVAWLGTVGQADENRPVDVNTIFNVASLTKPLFATLVMHLVQDGRLALDDPLAYYWIDPDVEDDPRHLQLTARLALSHQTGFPNWRGNNELAFLFDPGSRHEYSGEGFEYVRRALERKTGQTLSELMDQYITAPLGMEDTRFGWHHSLEEKIARGFDEQASPLDMGYLQQRSANAAANTFTTLADYTRFAAWVSRGAGLEPALFNDMMTLQSQHEAPWEYFGLGWRLVQLDNRTILEHDGRENGVRTQVFVDPAVGDGLVILTNSSNGELVVRPLVEAAWRDSDTLLRQRDLDTWHYLQSLPVAMHQGLLQFISTSPSFTQKLMHAAQIGLIEPAGLPVSEYDAIKANIDPFVKAFHDQQVNQPAVLDLLLMLGEVDGDSFRLSHSFTAEQAREWGRQIQL
ncbi:serine hydrolase domain-containing protein [Saccharospirillum impatiens]|uniref:serine hydrolase domain-containing protein n=1 Tax=Saccharospirillum impatiens TaxID=169438 RepID=UPI00040210C9|nr:serine hydrolase domain-containing protein [Saccharospirillum impatiens]